MSDTLWKGDRSILFLRGCPLTKRKKRKGKSKGKKWGSIGAPTSAKRKRHLAKIRRKRS